jgi:transcriptional regulator with XRE-family HTH domain
MPVGRRRGTKATEPIIPAPSGRYPGGIPEYIERAISISGGSAEALADKIGISRSRVSYWVHATGMPGIHTCLQLALLTGDDPKDILIMAGHDSTAAILDEVYGDRGDSRALELHKFDARFKLEEVIRAAQLAMRALDHTRERDEK